MDGYVHYHLRWLPSRPLLDEVHAKLPQGLNNHNNYTFRVMNRRNIVIAYLPSAGYGTTSAAIVAAQILFSFLAIYFVLLVGLRGRVSTEEANIWLSYTVVSKPTDTSGGMVRYDYEKTISGAQF
jgi:hypothetical protein